MKIVAGSVLNRRGIAPWSLRGSTVPVPGLNSVYPSALTPLGSERLAKYTKSVKLVVIGAGVAQLGGGAAATESLIRRRKLAAANDDVLSVHHRTVVVEPPQGDRVVDAIRIVQEQHRGGRIIICSHEIHPGFIRNGGGEHKGGPLELVPGTPQFIWPDGGLGCVNRRDGFRYALRWRWRRRGRFCGHNWRWR